MIPQHLSKSQEHFTPIEIVEAARKVLGEIDLDPASCAKANKLIRAKKFYTRKDDGLRQPWAGRVMLNPPGGTFTARRKSKKDPPVKTSKRDVEARMYWRTDSRAVAWWRKLIWSYQYDREVDEAIFIGFNLDILQASQMEGYASPLEFPICVPAERLCFGGADPTHGNVIVYLGDDVKLFQHVFSEFGAVKL